MGVIGRTHEEAEGYVSAFIDEHGWPSESIDLLRPRMTLGDPDAFGEQVSAILDAGIDGVTVNLLASAHDIDSIALAGEVLNKVMS